MLSFEPMEEAEFTRFLEWLYKDYAQNHAEAGTWSQEEALRMAEAEISRLLPSGRETPDHHLFKVLDEAGNRVGEVWYALQQEGGQKLVWVFWIGVTDTERRRGRGTEMLGHVEAEARRLGATQVGLHVFAKNSAARALYERMAYRPTGIIMRKTLLR